jgi:hypothetical protein
LINLKIKIKIKKKYVVWFWVGTAHPATPDEPPLVIKRKCLTLEIKQSVHRCFKNIWEVNGPNLGRMQVYRMVEEIFAVS